MSNHTPGPWAMNVIKIKGKPLYWGINGVSKPGDTYASGRIVDVHFSVPNHDRPTQEANARLIATAPDLLEALQGMLAWARRVKERNPGQEIANACAAIAKAEKGDA